MRAEGDVARIFHHVGEQFAEKRGVERVDLVVAAPDLHRLLLVAGGQQQRLCIARTIAQKPEVILFDEPTSALDPISTGKIEDLLEQLKADFTIVIVTHNMQQAARISQYTAFMYLGEVIEFDATNTIFMNPGKKQTQDYVTGRFG